MKIDFGYGQGTMTAELPDNTDIFIPGETVPDPDYIPEDKLEEAYLDSLAHPIGMPTLSELAHKGTTVTIIVPDRVKGGEQPTSHRKMSIKYILQELYKAVMTEENTDILEKSLKLSEKIREAGYVLLYLPGNIRKVCDGLFESENKWR